MNLNKLIFSIFIISVLFFFPCNFSEAAFFENKSNFIFLENMFFKKQKYLIFLIFFFPSVIFFKNKQFTLLIIFILIQFFIIIYWDSLILWIRDLAGDSLSEINTLNIYFIYSWLLSIFNFFKPNFEISNFIKFYSIGTILFILSFTFFKNKRIYSLYFPLITFPIFLYLFINFNINHLIGNITTQKDIKKFFKNSEIQFNTKNNLDLIIYLGESNSLLHSKKKIKDLINKNKILNSGKFINFDNIYSTHTHSTPTLLRLFSVAVDRDNNVFKPIVKRESINIFSFLDNSFNKSYISSTGKNGFNNIHYPIFFKDFNKKLFLNESDYEFEREFFLDSFQKIKNDDKKNNLIIFHSTVGHAPYGKYIPMVKDIDINNFPKNYSKKLMGDKIKNFQELLIYDEALKYNFKNLETIISKIDRKKPSILFYLSDHGESVYTGMGHDSSRLVHEMLRIPFFIFYNNEFAKVYGDIFKKEKSNKHQLNTTDILKKMIFKIYSLDQLNEKYINQLDDKYNKIIFQRNKKDTIEYIDLNFERIKLPKNYLLKDDKDTNIHILANSISKENICYHASNTIARIKRGLLITSCLEFDLNVENEQFYIYHPPNKNINFTLDELMNVSTEAKTYWIDGKNLNNVNNCNKLNFKLKNLKKKDSNFFVEFPSDISFENAELVSCIKELKKMNIDVSYYVSNKDIDACLGDLNSNNIFCNNLTKKISMINQENIFNNISFDYKFSKILNFFNMELLNVKFNTWHINYEEVKNLNSDKYNLIIPNNSNFNRNTF